MHAYLSIVVSALRHEDFQKRTHKPKIGSKYRFVDITLDLFLFVLPHSAVLILMLSVVVGNAVSFLHVCRTLKNYVYDITANADITVSAYDKLRQFSPKNIMMRFIKIHKLCSVLKKNGNKSKIIE